MDFWWVKFYINCWLIHPLTHWGQVVHICVGKLNTIGSDNGLSPGCHLAIIWSNAGKLLTRTVGANFSEILSKIETYLLRKMHLKMAAILSWFQCVKHHFQLWLWTVKMNIKAKYYYINRKLQSSMKQSKYSNNAILDRNMIPGTVHHFIKIRADPWMFEVVSSSGGHCESRAWQLSMFCATHKKCRVLQLKKQSASWLFTSFEHVSGRYMKYVNH